MKNLLILSILISLSSCYVYKVPTTPEDEEPKTIQEIVNGKNFYRIEFENQTEKIVYEKWDGDTLVAHGLHNKKKEFRIHKDDIKNVEERRFAKWPTNGITILAYIAIGAGIILLL